MIERRPATTRSKRPDDQPLLEALGLPRWACAGPATILERAGVVIGAAVFDLVGAPTEPGVPLLVAAWSRAAGADERLALLRVMLDQARANRWGRVLIGADPMDHNGLTLLEQSGFRPTGRGPYVTLGGGVVQYVTGYQDASGSTLDLEAFPGRSPG